MEAALSQNTRPAPEGDRRKFHRITFDAPLTARFGGERVKIVDLGVSGAGFIAPLSFSLRRTSRLEFEYEDTKVSVLAAVRGCRLVRTAGGNVPQYRTGVAFCDADAALGVRDVMIRLILRMSASAFT